MNPKTILALAALTTAPVMAGAPDNPFAVEWFTFDGGGGTSSSAGGEFSVRGTVGQPDQGTATGGVFSLQGGFWGLYGVIQTPGAPVLAIERLANGDLRVSWPLPATNWVLDGSATLGQDPNPWAEIDPGTYQTDATHRFVIIPNPIGNNFYGLRLPETDPPEGAPDNPN